MIRPTVREWGGALALFAVLTVAATWPFASRLRVVDAGDSAFFAWAIGWQTHALRAEPASLPHGNFYAPSRFTYFMDEPVLGTGLLVLPLSFVTDDAVLLFNLARLLTFVLTGLFTWRLARDLDLGNAPALAAGVFFAFSPIRVDQVAHLSTLGTQWIPLACLFARRYGLDPSFRHAAWTGLFFALSFLACGYHGLFFAVLLPLSLLTFLRSTRAAAFFGAAWPALLTAGAFLVPLYLMSRAALAPLRFSRSHEDTLRYAASIETFFAANRWNRVWGSITENLRGDPSNLFPGLVVVALSLYGVVRLRSGSTQAPRGLSMFIALGALAVALALGPEIRLRGQTLMPGPFALLRAVVPVFENVRATGRAGIFLALALAILAAAALATLRRASLISGIAAALFLLEARIAPIPTPAWTNVIDTRAPEPQVYAWLRSQPPGTTVAELPARAASDYARPAFHDSIYMVWSTRHWQPLVNGFAGAETPMIARFRALAPSFPEGAAIDVMKEAGTRYVVVHLRGFGPVQRQRLLEGVAATPARLREVARFPSGTGTGESDVVYEILS